MTLQSIRAWFHSVFTGTALSEPTILKQSAHRYTFSVPGMSKARYRVCHIRNLPEFYAYEASLQTLASPDDAQRLNCHPKALPWLLSTRLMTTLPYLWVVIDKDDQVVSTASLHNVENQTASYVGFNRLTGNPDVGILLGAITAISYGFEVMKLKTIQAEFTAEATEVNRFCTILGFEKQTSAIPLITYSLDAPVYLTFLKGTDHDTWP